ncbi:MAG TPA: APC family permease [Steroidobacteraceae bacterium]|jgi:amino acid transporter|nr:APC family permease [Steroidobacteraceae bacterium]
MQPERMLGAVTEPALEQFGYRQELKRSLGLPALIVYGLVFINPTSPFSIFGIVFNLSHGMVPLVYVIGLGAMLFTASSYVTMSRAFPVAGSVYSYAGHGIGPTAGFLAGWALLLDYVLMPTLIYVLCAIAIEALAPGVPRWLSIVVVLCFNTGINLRGIEASARLNAVLLTVMFAFLALFFALGVDALGHGVAGAHLSTAPLFRADAFSSAVIFGALSVATLNFLGFDGISTLVEEARDGAPAVGRALWWSVCLAAVLFIAATWLASLFVLDRTQFAPGPPTDGAFYSVAEIIGGTWFKAAASSKVLVAGVAVAAASQTATARLMYGMARDGRLPRVLAYVHPDRKVPQRAILFIAALNLVTALIFANSFELLTTLVCFGALVGFLMLHLSVLVHFRRQQSSRWGRHVVVPAFGGAIVAYVLWNMALDAQLVGVAWLAIGLGSWLLVGRLRA